METRTKINIADLNNFLEDTLTKYELFKIISFRLLDDMMILSDDK